MFENFLLARLLSERQAVLYCFWSQSEAYLFHHNQVYRRLGPIQHCFNYLPESTTGTHILWTLMNAEDGTSGPLPINPRHRIWPIQLSSPNPVQYKVWCKHFNAAQWVTRIWTEEELWAGYVFILTFVLQSTATIPPPC